MSEDAAPTPKHEYAGLGVPSEFKPERIGWGTNRDMCMILNLSHGRISQLRTAGVLPALQDRNQYDVILHCQTYIRYLQDLGNGGGITGDQTNAGKVAEIELKQQKARMARMDADLQDGQLVKVSEIAKGWDAVFTLAKRKFLVVGSRVAARWTENWGRHEIKEAIDTENRMALESMSRGEAAIDDDADENVVIEEPGNILEEPVTVPEEASEIEAP